MRQRLPQWLCVAGLLAGGLQSGSGLLGAEAIRFANIYDDGQAHAAPPVATDSSLIVRSWPFCPTNRIPCSESNLAWVELGISLDAYSIRRNDDHQSIDRIVTATHEDLAPVVEALRRHFDQKTSSDVERVAFTQGLVQAVVYEFDTDTGWTDYPKFGLEFLVDGKGDCDDAAITAAALLQGVGYPTWFVYWVGPDQGHLSTAITPDRGDLARFSPPEDSQWIEVPEGKRLLHVESTGATSGCGQAWVSCSSLGWNEWYRQSLRVETVVRSDDSRLVESSIPLAAWKNGGLFRPNRKLVDRRNASDEDIRREVLPPERQESTVHRLSNLGVPEEEAKVYLSHRSIDPVFATAYWAVCLGVLSLLGGTVWRRRRELQERGRHFRERRRQRKF